MTSRQGLDRLRDSASRFFAVLCWAAVPLAIALAYLARRSPLVPSELAFANALLATISYATIRGRAGRNVVAVALTLLPLVLSYSDAGRLDFDWQIAFFVTFAMLAAYCDWQPIVVAAACSLGSYAVLALFGVGPQHGVASSVLVRTLLVGAECGILLWIVGRMSALAAETESALALARETIDRSRLFESAVLGATEAVFFLRPAETAGGANRVTFVNNSFGEVTGFDEVSFIGRDILELFADPEDEPSLAVLRRFMGELKAVRLEMTMSHRDGTVCPAELAMAPIFDGAGKLLNWAGIVRDVTERKRTERVLERVKKTEEHNAALEREIAERKRVEEQLVHAAFHDTLTGLPNRALFIDRLQLAVERMRRGDGYLPGVLLIDFDRFKLINDSYGHGTGDLLLIAVSRRLEQALRSGDTLARLGGDEFTVLLDGIVDAADAAGVAERLLEALAEPFTLGSNQIYATASVGIAVGSLEYDRGEDLVRDADIAMYRAKALGKQRYEIFAEDLREHSQRLLRIETELRRALERGDLQVAYQPIVALDEENELRGFEALVRWHHAELGFVPPLEFITVAEETGMIVPLGEIVLRSACAQMRLWKVQFPNLPDLAVSVNVSAKQLLDPLFVDRVRAALAQNELEPRRLHLEVTESVLMADSERARTILAELHELGTEVHIDDFGTGYSSLAYLSQFHVDVVKIDRSFVSSQGSGVANPEIVMTVVTLAEHLGLAVTAEGIETAEQATQLRALHCTNAQGYHFSRPLNVGAATAYLDAVARERMRIDRRRDMFVA